MSWLVLVSSIWFFQHCLWRLSWSREKGSSLCQQFGDCEGSHSWSKIKPQALSVWTLRLVKDYEAANKEIEEAVSLEGSFHIHTLLFQSEKRSIIIIIIIINLNAIAYALGLSNYDYIIFLAYCIQMYCIVISMYW